MLRNDVKICVIYRRLFSLIVICGAYASRADVGDPQIATDHPWYPGELACSSFERLAASQASQYSRATKRKAESSEDKALASWFWRNTHYAHGEEGAENLWGLGPGKGPDVRAREYWTGLFAHGFGLCGTTHSQWTAEMEHLLGHGRSRGVGVAGHNSFEVFLTDPPYGQGKWALLDHDISTVIFDAEGKRLLSIPEVKAGLKKWTGRAFSPDKQRGWLVCGLHPDDGAVYASYTTAEYLPGYSSVPPMVHLRRGESLRRYLRPGLEEGKTFVFWGRNYNTAAVPGPERSITWVNQPDRMYQSTKGAGYRPGQVRYANAVYRYEPNFKNGDYREGVVDESGDQVTFEFYTPYIIGCTPPNNNKPWGIYDEGGRNGLVVQMPGDACRISISVDQGKTWREPENFHDGIDWTDFVKGHRQYFIRFHASPERLANSRLVITTVCQANSAILPRLKDNGSEVTFLNSRQAVVSAGPNKPQAAAHIIAGSFDSPAVTMEIRSPRGEPALAVYASAHIASGNPPSPNTKYQIDFSIDGGKRWQPVVKDWSIPRLGNEPADFWSQTLCYGSAHFASSPSTPVQVRFHNDGRKKYLRAEAHLVYRTAFKDSTRVAFGWKDNSGDKTASHLFAPGTNAPWHVSTGAGVQTRWVEFSVQ